jgi:hypothetical protein
MSIFLMLLEVQYTANDHSHNTVFDFIKFTFKFPNFSDIFFSCVAHFSKFYMVIASVFSGTCFISFRLFLKKSKKTVKYK